MENDVLRYIDFKPKFYLSINKKQTSLLSKKKTHKPFFPPFYLCISSSSRVYAEYKLTALS